MGLSFPSLTRVGVLIITFKIYIVYLLILMGILIQVSICTLSLELLSAPVLG